MCECQQCAHHSKHLLLTACCIHECSSLAILILQQTSQGHEYGCVTVWAYGKHIPTVSTASILYQASYRSGIKASFTALHLLSSFLRGNEAVSDMISTYWAQTNMPLCPRLRRASSQSPSDVVLLQSQKYV